MVKSICRPTFVLFNNITKGSRLMPLRKERLRFKDPGEPVNVDSLREDSMKFNSNHLDRFSSNADIEPPKGWTLAPLYSCRDRNSRFFERLELFLFVMGFWHLGSLNKHLRLLKIKSLLLTRYVLRHLPNLALLLDMDFNSAIYDEVFLQQSLGSIIFNTIRIDPCVQT
jgi:hypothetical protein